MAFISPFDEPQENPNRMKKPKENSTRCQIQIFDTWPDGVDKKPGCMLYHHSDGYPEFMKPKLEKFLKAAYPLIRKAHRGWQSEEVGAVLIMLSVEDYNEPLLPFSTIRPDEYVSGNEEYRPSGGIPVFIPTMQLHGDIEYLYKVVIGGGEGDFKITYKKV